MASMDYDKMIDEFCRLLKHSKSFDDLEIKLLKAMLELKYLRKMEKSEANKIADKARISVTNAYKYLYSLQEKGLIESTKSNGQKLFWLTLSRNPFPRLFSDVGLEYLKRKDIFFELEKMYNQLDEKKMIWQNEKVHEHYDNNFVNRAAFLFDIAEKEILITTRKFYDELVLLDALKRAVERGVTVKIISEEVDPKMTDKLRKIGIDMRLGYGWPYIIVADEYHGMSVDADKKGVWFLNYKTEFKEKFLGFWKNADEI